MNFETLLTRITCAENSFDSLTSCQGPRTDLWLRQHLLRTYISRIDPIVKILHYPSIHAYLSDGEPYLGYDLWHPAPAALASAICYAASCSLDEDKCLYMFNMTKEALISKYRKETEMALERFDFILTNDLTVLQAFVISLVNWNPRNSHIISRLTGVTDSKQITRQESPPLDYVQHCSPHCPGTFTSYSKYLFSDKTIRKGDAQAFMACHRLARYPNLFGVCI